MFESKALVAFAGVHSLQQQVYFYARQPALAILLQQPVQDEMKVVCTGRDIINALCLAQTRMNYVRIVSEASQQFIYEGVWLITNIKEQSAESVQVSMMSIDLA